MLKQILGIGLAILLGIGSAWYAVKWYSSQPPDMHQPQALPAGGDFSLHAPDKTLSLHDLKGKVVVLYEDTFSSSFGAEVAAWINENCFEYLDAPVMRCGSLDTAIPMSKVLEDDFLAKARLGEVIAKLLSY